MYNLKHDGYFTAPVIDSDRTLRTVLIIIISKGNDDNAYSTDSTQISNDSCVNNRTYDSQNIIVKFSKRWTKLAGYPEFLILKVYEHG